METLQLLVLKINNEEMGLDIKFVDQIIPYKETVEVPNTPDFIEGLLSLRGKVYTVFNMRKRFHFPPKEYDDNTKIVIVNIDSIKVALIVDEVSEILRLEESDIDGAPKTFEKLDKKFVSGIANISDRIIIIMNLNEIITFSSEELKEDA